MIALIVILSAAVAIATPVITVKSMKKHRFNVVFRTSEKRKKVAELNQKYIFKNPKTKWSYIHHCENLNKFRKMDEDLLEKDFFKKYYSDILLSLQELRKNKEEYESYIDELNSILSEDTIIPADVKLKPDVYKKYEKDILKPMKKSVKQELTIDLRYEYTSPAGRNHYESDPHILNYSDITGQTLDSFAEEHNPILQEEPETLPIGGAYIGTPTVFNASLKERAKNCEFARKHDYFVTLHVEISVVNKFVYYFDFFNRYNKRKFQYRDFRKTADPELVKKVDHLNELLSEVYYLESPERIIDYLSLVKEDAAEADNFHLDMKEITLDMVKELDYKFNASFSCDLSGNICVDMMQIGIAADVDLYLEENPSSIYVQTVEWIYQTLEDINSSSRNKIASLHSKIIDKSNSRCKFNFVERVNIRIDIDFDLDSLEIKAEPHYLYGKKEPKPEIERALAKVMTYDKTIFLACDSFIEEVRKINDYYSSRLSTIIKKIIALRESYKDNDKICFVYSETIRNTEEWMQHFNLRPNVDPIVLDELKDGDLVCNDSILSIMRDYQKYAFNWANKLVSNSFSGILADDMGLGKTLEMISVINADKTNMPNLIVCPVSLLHNWEKEFFKWCPEEKVVLRRSFNTKLFDKESNFQSKINYIVSYDFMIHHADKLKNIRFNYLILDEAQYIKNEKTSRSKHAKMLVANHRFALTGTPLENKTDDLINIFDFVLPSLNVEYKLKNLSRSIQREYISPFLLRRKKTDVLNELPEKNTIIVDLDMGDSQRSLYDTYKITQADHNDQYLQLFALLTKLRQICVCPQLIVKDSKIESTKINYMFELIDNIMEDNESVLIYSFFASVFDIIEPLMKERRIKYVRLDGSVKPDDRQSLIDEFDKNDDIHCFLISLKAGGVGLNLTKANNVIFLDPWWNIAVENQAADRTHRIGQTKNVTIYRLICKDTVEEKVLNIQKEKLDLINFFVESDGDDPLGKLTIDMMKELLK